MRAAVSDIIQAAAQAQAKNKSGNAKRNTAFRGTAAEGEQWERAAAGTHCAACSRAADAGAAG